MSDERSANQPKSNEPKSNEPKPNNPKPDNPPAEDPILAERARWSSAADWGKRLGYGFFLGAMVAFFVGLATTFTDFWGWLMFGCLLVGSVLLLPAIIIGYAVKAADRHDLGLPSGH